MDSRFNTHEGFVWNFARITASATLSESSEKKLAKLALREDPPELPFESGLPLNLNRESPMILATGVYSGMRPHVYVSMALTTQKASRVVNKALWSLVRELYLDPRYDKADLSEWLAEGMAFSLVFTSQNFLNRIAEMGHYVVTDPKFNTSNPDRPLAVASFRPLGYEAMPGMR